MSRLVRAWPGQKFWRQVFSHSDPFSNLLSIQLNKFSTTRTPESSSMHVCPFCYLLVPITHSWWKLLMFCKWEDVNKCLGSRIWPWGQRSRLKYLKILLSVWCIIQTPTCIFLDGWYVGIPDRSLIDRPRPTLIILSPDVMSWSDITAYNKIG